MYVKLSIFIYYDLQVYRSNLSFDEMSSISSENLYEIELLSQTIHIISSDYSITILKIVII